MSNVVFYDDRNSFRCKNTLRTKHRGIMTNLWDKMGTHRLKHTLHTCSLNFRLCKNSSPLLFFSVAVLTLPLTSSAQDCGYEGWQCCCSAASLQPDRNAGCRNFKITVGLLTQTLQASREARFNVFRSVKKKKKKNQISRGRRKWREEEGLTGKNVLLEFTACFVIVFVCVCVNEKMCASVSACV